MTASLPKLAIAVMSKAPISGEAKTRLGRDVGHAAASCLQRAFLLDTLAVFGQVAELLPTVARMVICPNSRHADVLRDVVPSPWRVRSQGRPGLMGGIADAFDDGFAAGADVVLVADADSPSLPVEHVLSCVAECLWRDVVLGPTRDGGYYLISARRTASDRLPALLTGHRFEGATVCADTVRVAGVLGLTSAMGPTWFDVDTLAELSVLAADLDGARTGALVHTRDAVNRLGLLDRLRTTPAEAYLSRPASATPVPLAIPNADL